MTTSRTRRPRRTGPDRLRARRRHDRAERTLRQVREVPPEIQAAIDELEGYEHAADARGARGMFERDGGLRASPAAVLDLLEVARLEDGGCAPSWVYDRWVARQAHRWLPRDPAGRLMAVLGQTDFAARPTPPQAPGEDVADYARRAIDDHHDNWLAHQVGVYEMGGLRAFLSAYATPALTDRARSIRRWVDAPWGVYASGHLTAGTLEVTDLRTHERTRVVHLGAASEVPADQTWLGRIVPIEDDPGHLFESPPLPLDETTARTLADGDLSTPRVLAVLRDAIHLGRLPQHLASREPTDLSCDLGRRPALEHDDPPFVELLAELGRAEREVADQLMSVGISQDGLDAILLLDSIEQHLDTGTRAPAAMTPLLVPMIVERRAFQALLDHRTGPEHAEVWRHVHHHTPSYARERCRRLLDACGA